MAYKPIKTHETSVQDKFKENVIYLAITIFLAYIMDKFLSFLFSPLTNRTDSEGVREMVEAKQLARKEYLDSIAEDLNDPMYQFQLRFIEEPGTYRKDPDSKVYKTWYQEWKKGQVLDSTLRWVPEVYDEDENFNPNFLEYMKMQWSLHRKASLTGKGKFLNTIRRYYPEFSASFKGMEQDLARYCAMVTEEKLEGELRGELEKYGLPLDFAEYLMEKDLSPKELQRQATFLRACVEAGYSLDASTCALENKLSLEEADALNSVTENGLPAKVGIAFLKKELTAEDLKELAEFSNGIGDLYGLDAFKENQNGSTIYDEMIDQELRSYKNKKRAMKFV